VGLTPLYVCPGDNLYICKIVLGGIVETNYFNGGSWSTFYLNWGCKS